MTHPSNPVVIDLAQWLGASRPHGDLPEVAELELRDSRLADARALLSSADRLIHDLLSQDRPESAAPFVASELSLIADQLARLPEPFDDSEQDPTLLCRAAVLCAGHEWARLSGLQPRLRLRVSCVDEAIAETAVRLARLSRSGPRLASTPALRELEAQEQLVNDGLHHRAVLAGSGSAFAAADAAFLPSLADFLR